MVFKSVALSVFSDLILCAITFWGNLTIVHDDDDVTVFNNMTGIRDVLKRNFQYMYMYLEITLAFSSTDELVH